MKFHDFVDKTPAIGKLVIIEGTERSLAELAVDLLIERVLSPDMRDLNLERFPSSELDTAGRVGDAVQAMPFLAASRLVIVTDTQILKTPMRKALWAVAESVPDGNTLVLVDLLAPKALRPQPFGAVAGRGALRIDTTASQGVRERFIIETLTELKAQAEPRVIEELARSQAELAAVRNDLEKLALAGKKITYKDLEQESLAIEDPKAYKYASALVEGRVADALEIAQQMFADDPRGAGIPLISALATECGLLWEMARPGGTLPARAKWRERFLRPVAARIGERRARLAYERAVRGFEAIVTGKNDDPKLLVEMITAELSAISR
ncbi:MAG: DNA polymerase III subunit delta [Candidatus Baltobacteraceae bacterium]